MSSQASQIPQLARGKQVCAALGVSRSALHEWIRAGKFPAPIKLGNRNAWPWSVVREWLDAQSKAVPA